MHFLIEKDNKNMETEAFLWKQILSAPGVIHKYSECTIAELPNIIEQISQDIIPLGCINFTQHALKLKYNIDNLNPIEIPNSLRIPTLLGREYKVVPAHMIPTSGKWLIKDGSAMKGTLFIGNVAHLSKQDINPNHKYVVSEIVDILAEYRVYIIGGEVYACEYYNGDPLLFPNASTIRQANFMYSQRKDYPKSYTMDVMITKDGTLLTEIHPTLFACGLYTTILSTKLLQGYQDALGYALKHNTTIELS